MEEQTAKKIARIGSIAGIAAVVALVVVLVLPNVADVSIRGHDVADVDGTGPTYSVENYCPELLRQGDFCLDTAPTVDVDDPYLEMLRQGDFYRNIAPTVDVDDPYLELLKQGDSYLNMTPGEQEAYVQVINEMRSNYTVYEREVWKLFDAISLLELESQAADKAGDRERAERIGSEIRALLTAYYAAAIAEGTNNPHYGGSLAAEARDRINNQTGNPPQT